jgi:hypothetical protein
VPNFFNDNPNLLLQFRRLDLEEVVRMHERDFTEADVHPDAPKGYDEAMATYRSALELVGGLAGDFIAPRARAVDVEGATLENGKVRYAQGTREALDKLAEVGLMGVILPRKYGGANFPATIYFMMIELVSRADASLMTLFGYQDVGETIARLGTEAQGREFLLRYCTGEWTGATCLSEPGAGSDLQAVRLQASRDASGQWRLKGIKHFISNGCGDVLVVLARSEPGTDDMFGLSLFVCHRDATVRVARLEDKMGLNGSPTCELHFEDTPAQLLGRRRFGLMNVLHILNHARFSVAAQALGLAEAAYREALHWCRGRVQFGKTLYAMPPIANTLIDMRVTIEAGRSLLYASTQWLDVRNRLEEAIAERKAHGRPLDDLPKRFDQAARYVDLLSPLVKYSVTEAANRVVYDALQLHGGMGYMKDSLVERLYRDVRVTSIYEGATSIQVVGAAKGVVGDALGDWFEESARSPVRPALRPLADRLATLRAVFLAALAAVRARGEPAFGEAAARDLTDMYGDLFTGHLLLKEAGDDERQALVATRFVKRALARAAAGAEAIRDGQYADLRAADVFCGRAPAAP